MDKLAENMEEMYVIMCADPADESVQEVLNGIDWEEQKKELGIKRNISENVWQLASEAIRAECAGDEDKWQYVCQMFHDGQYDEDEVGDAISLQYNALKRMI